MENKENFELENELNQNQFAGIEQKQNNEEQNNHDTTELLQIVPEEEAELTYEELEEAKKSAPDGIELTKKKYRISDEDAAKALEAADGVPKVLTETKNGVPPQWWLVPLNNGAFLLASLIPGLNIIFLPVLLANLKILPMATKKKQENVVSSQPARKTNRINPNNNKPKSTPTKKQNFGVESAPKTNFGMVPNDGTNFGEAAKSKQSFGEAPADMNFEVVPNDGTNFDEAAKSKQSFGIDQQNKINRLNVFNKNRIISQNAKIYNHKAQANQIVGPHTKKLSHSTKHSNSVNKFNVLLILK